MTRRPFVTFKATRDRRNNTVLTVRHFTEGVSAIGIRGRFRQAVCERRQVRRTSARVQFNFHVRQRAFVGRVVGAVRVAVHVRGGIDRTLRREAEVSGQLDAVSNRHFLTVCTFKRGARARVDRNHTVITIWNRREQVLAVRIGLYRVDQARQRAQVHRTVACVQVHRDVAQHQVVAVVEQVAIVIDVRLIPNLTVWREAEVSRQHVGGGQSNILTASPFDASTTIGVGHANTVVTGWQIFEQVSTVHVRLGRRNDEAQTRNTGLRTA